MLSKFEWRFFECECSDLCLIVSYIIALQKRKETADTHVVYILCHVYEAFMDVEKKGHLHLFFPH